jgi:hypothetical protein
MVSKAMTVLLSSTPKWMLTGDVHAEIAPSAVDGLSAAAAAMFEAKAPISLHSVTIAVLAIPPIGFRCVAPNDRSSSVNQKVFTKRKFLTWKS